MDFKKGFTPGWTNTIIAAAVAVSTWLFLYRMLRVGCAPMRLAEVSLQQACENTPPFTVLLAHCGCYTWSLLFLDLGLSLLMPFIVTYAIVSLIRSRT